MEGMISWLYITSFHLSISLNTNQIFLFDNLSLVIILFTTSLIYLTICAFPNQQQFIFGIFFCCMIFFTCKLILIVYMRYEIVILPLIALVIAKGWYRERLYATLVIMGYTLLFSLPGIVVILLFQGSWARKIPFTDTNELINFWLALIFLVKLPIWGLHYWLPLAHVEAPTAGRILLAGILLKLGGYGLIRFSVRIGKEWLIFFVAGILLRTLACCAQLDIKRTIAYSSVSHIIIIPILLIHNSALGKRLINIIIFSHGFSRAALFFLVGIIYKCTNTRNLILLKGLFYTHPNLVFFFTICILIGCNIPPFIGFFREVLGFLCILQLSPYLILPVVLYFILRLVYIVNILSTILLRTNHRPSTLEIIDCKENMLITWIILINSILLLRLEIF